MNSIILCEGSTDYVLLQYYMRRVYGWEDDINQKSTFRYAVEPSRRFIKADNTLTIAATGGVSGMPNAIEKVLDKNELASPFLTKERMDKILIFTDHDDEASYEIWKQKIEEIARNRGYDTLDNDRFVYQYTNKSNQQNRLEVLLLVIPFEEKGALETFLLQAIANGDIYDKQIIESCNEFVECVDPEKRYLKHRRLIVKAKFDVYFSIRLAWKQFRERQDILKGIPWEDYDSIHSAFKLLGELS